MSDLFSTLQNITKSVKDNLNTYEIRKVTEKMHDMVMNYSEAEMAVRNATNEDPWGPTGPELKEISHLTYQYDTFPQVMCMLWKRMFEDNRVAWRRVYKSLMVLNHLLQHGSERVVGNAKDHMYQIRQLEHYNHTDERGKDQGVNVRHRAKLILELLQDEDKLRAERKKAKGDNKERYQGFSKHEMSGGAGNFSSKSSSNYRERDDDYKDEYEEYSDRDRDKDQDTGYNGDREVSSFQFPSSARRNSLSPELGFRDRGFDRVEEAIEDDFGDFASARNNSSSTKAPIPQVQTAHLQRVANVSSFPTAPAIAPPTAVQNSAVSASSNKHATSFDLLGLDTGTSAAPVQQKQQPDFFASMPAVPPPVAAPPRPPSGGGISPKQVGSGGALVDDFFSSPTSSTQPNAFQKSWVSSPSPPAQTLSPVSPNGVSTPLHNEFADFANFSGASQSATPLTSPPAPARHDLTFDLLAPITSTPLSATPLPSATKSAAATPQKDTKIGSTWAGASSLINLDNLGKSPQVKQSPSLNQMQARSHGGAAPSNIPW